MFYYDKLFKYVFIVQIQPQRYIFLLKFAR